MKDSCDDRIRSVLASGSIRVDVDAGTVWRGDRRAEGRPSGGGYLQVGIGDRRMGYIHRIVWIAAHGSIPNGMTIDHLNGSKEDNRLANLEAVTVYENINRHVRGNHLDRQVLEAFMASNSIGGWMYEVLEMFDDGATMSDMTDYIRARRHSVDGETLATQP